VIYRQRSGGEARDEGSCVFVRTRWCAFGGRGLGDARGQLIPGRVGLSAG
jgi:hypothetical protein